MRGTISCVAIIALTACGGHDITSPDDSIPVGLLPGDGVLRFTLGSSCPEATIMFKDDIFYLGPIALKPGQSQDYQVAAGTHTTSASFYPAPTRTLPQEATVVVAGQRVTRTLSCS